VKGALREFRKWLSNELKGNAEAKKHLNSRKAQNQKKQQNKNPRPAESTETGEE
jgi:hypothetical protein